MSFDLSALNALPQVRKGSVKSMDGFSMDAKQRKAWTETRSALLWAAPAFAHLYFTMMVEGLPDGVVWCDEVPIAATDGKHLLLNPEPFFKHTLPERVFIAAHEICHCMLNHCGLFHAMNSRKYIIAPDGTRLPWVPLMGNMAADYIINDMLIDSGIGQYNPNWLHDRSIGTNMDALPVVYARLFEAVQKKVVTLQGNGTGTQQGFDEHLQPGASEGKDANEAISGRSQAEWDAAVAAAVAAAKAQGKLPAAMDRMFSSVLEPQVDWMDKIRALLLRRVGDDGLTWKRPNRRYIVNDVYLPSRIGHSCGPIGIVIDTSGSITQKILDFFFAEMKGILTDVNPEKVYVIWCDAQVHSVQEIEDVDDIGTLKPKGGGGTDFRPPFIWLDKHDVEVDALVYLTDMYGDFPKSAPTYPVIWARMSDVNAPWGDVVDIKIN